MGQGAGLVLAFALALAHACRACAGAGAPTAPTISIGMFPSDNTSSNLGFYRRWVTQFGGVNVVTLPHNYTGHGNASKMFASLDALLLPGVMFTKPNDVRGAAGSGARGSRVPRLAQELFQLALDANHAGRYFPVWGTCIGFEWILAMIGGAGTVTPGFDSVDFPRTLDLTPRSPGRMFSLFNATMLGWVATRNITYNDHSYGITPLRKALNAKLDATLDVLATSADRRGRAFVAAYEGKTLPIYGTQFHPEHVEFVPGRHIPKSPAANATSIALARFFVNQARKGKAATHAELRAQ